MSGLFLGLDLGLSGATSNISEIVPEIASSTPSDDSFDVEVDSAIVITFNVPVSLGTGSIVLRDVTGAADEETFNAATGSGDGGGTVTVDGNALTITPGSDMTGTNAYSIRIAATAVDNAANTSLSFVGITDDTTLNFNTVVTGQPVGMIPFTYTKAA